MNSIIVVFPKTEDGKSIRNLLTRHGYDVTAVCTLGSQALNCIDMMNDGVIVCGYKFSDMYYFDLKNALPQGFDMLLLASARVCAECSDPGIVCVPMPLKVQDLMNTLEMMCMNQARRRKKKRTGPRQRSEEETKVLWEAKEILMERNHMTEEEAHRYIQKCSMDSGTSLAETARMVISMTKI
ncbi:MAG: ANTAR domain-containing protein [Eubacteriales bacterium]|nr:ANTAR domain-containing protein [Eubacteriales bacterium]